MGLKAKHRTDLGKKTKQIALRLDEDLGGKIEAYARRLQALAPGVEITFADATRSLIVLGLEADARASSPAPAARPKKR
jgi:hypothetical protein